MYFEEYYQKKEKNDNIKFLIFAAVIGVGIYFYTTKQTKPLQVSFGRNRSGSSAADGLKNFMTMYRG